MARRPQKSKGRKSASTKPSRKGRSPSRPKSGDGAKPSKRAGNKPEVHSATIDKSNRKFGFLIFDDRSFEDVFLPPRHAREFFHGDRVSVEISGRGEIVDIELIEHRFKELVGRMELDPSHTRGAQVIWETKSAREIVPITGPVKAKEGDWVRVTLDFEGRGRNRVTGEITENFGPDLPAKADVEKRGCKQ